MNILDEANELKYVDGIVSIPTNATGTGFPVKERAEVMFETCVKWCKLNGSKSKI